MRKQLVALTLSAAMAAGMLSGCGGYGSGSGGQKDAAEAAGTAAGAAATTAAAGSDGTAEPAKASTADGEGIKIIKGKSKHNKKRFPIPGAFLQHVFGDLIPLIC